MSRTGAIQEMIPQIVAIVEPPKFIAAICLPAFLENIYQLERSQTDTA